MAQSDLIISKPVSAVTPVISSLAGALRVYIENNFPKGYFKDYFIDTDIPIVQFRRKKFRPLSKSQVSIRKLPLLSVKVDVTTDSSEYSIGDSWHRGNRFMQDPTDLQPILMDDVDQRFIGFHNERIVCRFQVSIVLETEMKAREVAMYMKRVLPLNYKTFLNEVMISTEIPSDILRQVWFDKGYGNTASAVEVDEFHKYLKAFSAGHIERNFNSASGRSSFFFHYLTNILMSIAGAPTVSINRDANVVRNAQLDIPVEFDLSVPMAYSYRQNAEVVPAVGDPDWMGSEGNMAYFNRALSIRPPLNIEPYLSLAQSCSFITPDLNSVVDRTLPDVTDISGIIPEYLDNHIVKIVAANEQALKLNTILYCNNAIVPQTDYTFDYEEYKISIFQASMFYNQKYIFCLYVNLEDVTNEAVFRREQAERPDYKK